jgi:dimethylsulfoniopropionate demethylase
LLIARSGWSKQGGFEIYLHDSSLGLQLWDDIWQAGEPFSLRAGCPNLIERIEGGLLSYGNDMTRYDTPLECGLEKYCELDSNSNFIGKSALIKQKQKGIERSLAGLRIDGPPIRRLQEASPCRQNNKNCGYVTSAVFSPDFDTNIAIAMVSTRISRDEEFIEVFIDGEWRMAACTMLPFTKAN